MQLDTEVEGGGLKEADAWPAQPQDAYGLEKLATEELCMHYDKDFGIQCRIARFHNIYGGRKPELGGKTCVATHGSRVDWRGRACKHAAGSTARAGCTACLPTQRPCDHSPRPNRPRLAGPYGTWKGGREKAPAAFCRKALTAKDEIEMWGDGKQTRSFTFIDDCVEGILRITKSDFRQPLNLGSCEMVSRGAAGIGEGEAGGAMHGVEGHPAGG